MKRTEYFHKSESLLVASVKEGSAEGLVHLCSGEAVTAQPASFRAGIAPPKAPGHVHFCPSPCLPGFFSEPLESLELPVVVYHCHDERG